MALKPKPDLSGVKMPVFNNWALYAKWRDWHTAGPVYALTNKCTAFVRSLQSPVYMERDGSIWCDIDETRAFNGDNPKRL